MEVELGIENETTQELGYAAARFCACAAGYFVFHLAAFPGIPALGQQSGPGIGEDQFEDGGNFFHFFDPHPKAGYGGGAHPQSGRVPGTIRIEGQSVAIQGDTAFSHRLFSLTTIQPEGSDVDQEKVVVGAPGGDAEASLDHGLGQGAGVFPRFWRRRP